MKQRLITAAVGLLLLVVVLLFFETPIYNAALAFLAALAAFEFLQATKCTQHKLLTVISVLFAAAVPFLRMTLIRSYSILFVLLFVLALFALLLYDYKNIRIEKIGIAFFVSTIFPFALTSMAYIRDEFGATTGLFYTLLIFGCAWGADAGAFFIGKLFGKRKLAPSISPNKTVEGFFGGFLGSAVVMGLVTVGYHLVMEAQGTPVTVQLLPLAAAWLFGTLLSVFGDLSASIVKRQCAIKDFGSIMPGHGGVVDRFDSIFFVAPFFYALLQFFPI